MYSMVCEQQRCRQACASAQSNQHLCYSLSGKYHYKKPARSVINFNFLIKLWSWAGWFEFHIVINPEDGFLALLRSNFITAALFLTRWNGHFIRGDCIQHFHLGRWYRLWGAQWLSGRVLDSRPNIANYHYGDVAKIDSLISLGISVGLRVDFPNDFRGFTMCSAGQWHSGGVLICV